MLDLTTLANVVMAILTLVMGLVTGWLAKHASTPASGPVAVPITPAAPAVTMPKTKGILDTLAASLANAGNSFTFPGSDAHATKQELFHVMSQAIIALPLAPDSKGKAIQDLTVYLDRLFAPPPPPPPLAK